MMNMNKELFDQAVSGSKPVLVEFWAPWCTYCRRIAPVLPKVEIEYADRVTVAQVNIDDHPELAQQERIELIPTLVVYKEGKALGSIVAPDSKAKIDALIEECLK